MEQTDTPRYLHDCETCTFLGGFLFEDHHYDLYYCPQGGVPTVIGRFGNGELYYMSGAHLGDPVLVEAYKRATLQGLKLY